MQEQREEKKKFFFPNQREGIRRERNFATYECYDQQTTTGFEAEKKLNKD